MTTFATAVPTATPTSTPRRSRRTRAASVVTWAVRALLAAQFVAGGMVKLAADASMVDMFTDIGAGQELRLLVGACEVAGAVGLLIPRLARAAAGGLVLLMIGATITNLVILQINPAMPLVFAALSATVAVALTSQRTRKENLR